MPRASNRAKGRKIVNLAKACLEEKKALVCVAPLQAQFIGHGRFISIASDYFGLWDLIFVKPDGLRAFAQVTTWNHISERRTKIVERGFPCTTEDLIFGYVEGRGRHFRVLRGPAFETALSEEWEIKLDMDEAKV